MTEEKAKIYLKSSTPMDETVINQLRELYGLNPNVMPFALQFPHIPPGLFRPMVGINNLPKEKFANKGKALNPQLSDFKEMYHQFASGLIDYNSTTLIPPGHPLFSRQNSVETLRAENSMLKQENMELKKQIDKSITEKSKHNP